MDHLCPLRILAVSRSPISFLFRIEDYVLSCYRDLFLPCHQIPKFCIGFEIPKKPSISGTFFLMALMDLFVETLPKITRADCDNGGSMPCREAEIGVK